MVKGMVPSMKAGSDWLTCRASLFHRLRWFLSPRELGEVQKEAYD